MARYYSATTNGFYDPAINAVMPPDAVSITDLAYEALFAAQAAGSTIGPDSNGNPVATPPAAPAPAQLGQAAYGAAIAAGCQIVSAGTPALNGTYPLDDSTLIKMVGEQSYIALKGTFTNGQAPRAWMDSAGTPHMFPSTDAFTAFGEAVAQYIDALQTALAAALEGGAWVAPAQPVMIA